MLGDYATGYRTASIAAGFRSTIVAPGYAPGMGYGSPMGTVFQSAVSASGSRSRTDSAFPYAATASGIVYEMGCMPLEQEGVLSTVRLRPKGRSRASKEFEFLSLVSSPSITGQRVSYYWSLSGRALLFLRCGKIRILNLPPSLFQFP